MTEQTAQRHEALFRQLAAKPEKDTRNLLVEHHIGFAHHVARAYRNRGIDRDDLDQVALVGLVNAVDRYNPEFGTAFTTFARATIEGDIKRHFRDRVWGARVPRPMKELHLQVRQTSDDLCQELGRTPTTADVANSLGISPSRVAAALIAAGAYAATSISTLTAVEPARDDERLEATADRVLLERLLAGLPSLERRILELRYFSGLSQAAIGARVGVSQMQVSRLLRRSVAALRATAGDQYLAPAA